MAIIQAEANLMPIGAENRLPTLEEYHQASNKERRRIRQEYYRRGLKPPHGLKGKPSPRLGISNPSKGRPRPHMQGRGNPGARGPRPHMWSVGPDPELHALHQPWHKARAQANFRKELWTLSFEDWVEIWDGRFHLRGRGADNLCMMMQDPDLGWTKTNAIIVTRREQLKLQKINRKK
jgi:hypothetical protein